MTTPTTPLIKTPFLALKNCHPTLNGNQPVSDWPTALSRSHWGRIYYMQTNSAVQSKRVRGLRLCSRFIAQISGPAVLNCEQEWERISECCQGRWHRKVQAKVTMKLQRMEYQSVISKASTWHCKVQECVQRHRRTLPINTCQCIACRRSIAFSDASNQRERGSLIITAVLWEVPSQLYTNHHHHRHHNHHLCRQHQHLISR